MSITVSNLTEASALLRTIKKRDILDVRAIDLDLVLILENGHKLIISRGAAAAANTPQLTLEFADGDVALGEVFEKLNHIEVPPDTPPAATLTPQEIKRYGIKRVVKGKTTKNDENTDEQQTASKPETTDGKPADALASSDSPSVSQHSDASSTAIKSSLATPSVTEASAGSAADSSGSSSFSWPVIAGGLGLLAAAGGGGGGGGAAAAAPAAGSGPALSTLGGATSLGPLTNATVTAYDSQGRMIGKPVPVINGRYSLVLDVPGYKGLILLAVRDSTPGVADNFADEATLRIADLGDTVLRSVVQAEGGNQTINITALTELAALKAGLASGQTNLGAASQVTAPTVAAANAAVSALFMVNISSGDVLTTTVTDANGAAAINPAFARSSNTSARHYGIALKAIANLQLTDATRYPDQGVAIQKLADSLGFSDTQPNKLKWRDTVTQSDLFNERIASRANDSSLSAEQRQQARALLDVLQKLPDGGSVNDYLVQNRVALPEPTLLTKNATPGASPWQTPATDGRLVLDQGELANGGLAVKAPPQARVEVTLVGHDAQGREVTVTLPASAADSNGIAVLRADQAALDLFRQISREQPVTARVTVTDGDNSRANQDVWKNNADVRIDVSTPPGLTDFASNKIALVNDTFYNGGDGNDPLRTTPLGNEDQITTDAAVRVLLTRVLKPEERLEFKVATSAGADNAPRYGEWFNPADLRIEGTDSNGQVRYVARNLTTSEGPVWIKARILLTAAQSGASQGSARELETPLRLTLDKTAPAQVRLAMTENRDDGLSSEDGVSSQTGVILMPRTSFETSAEVHLRLLGGSGTDGTTLLLLRANGERLALAPESWMRWQAGDQLQLIGQTLQGNGKARLQVRQLDAAGNFTDSIQTFISDSTRVIEQVVLLAVREKAFNEAKAAVIAAQEAYDQAAAADKPAKQTTLAAAQNALQQAQAARDQAPEQVRLGLLKSDGSTRLSDLMGRTIDPALLPAILRAVAATGDPEQVNDGPGLRTLVNNVVSAVTAVLLKASVYGDNDANPALTAADFDRLGIPGADHQATLTLANAALKTLPASRSNTIAALRTIVDAAARVAALADGAAGNSSGAALPSAADYTALGVTTPLSEAAARVTGQVIDGKPLTEVSTTAQLETIAAAAQRVTQHAAGVNLATPLTAQDFSALGIRGVTADNVGRLADALRDVPSSLRPATVDGVVDTLAEIRAIVALDLGTLQTLLNFAQHLSPIDPANPALLAPTLAQYDHPDLRAAGAEVTAARLASINDALSRVGAEAVDSWAKVGALVRSYTAILNAADGVSNAAALPTEADYSRIGVKTLQNKFSAATDNAARANAATLLGNVIDRSNRAEVDTVAKLESLADIVSRVTRIAAGKPETVSAEEWKRLHVSPELSADQLRIVLPAIAASADDGSEVTTLAALSTRASNALGSAQRITDYANDAANTAPAQADYKNIGVSGVDDAQLVGAINSALATPAVTGSQVASLAALQTLVDTYRQLLQQADGKAGNTATANLAKLADFERIGVDMSALKALDSTVSGATGNAVQLLSSIIDSRNASAIDTAPEIQQLAGLAHKLALAMQGRDAGQLQSADLALIGLDVDAGTLVQVRQQLASLADNGSELNTFSQLRALVLGVAGVPTWNVVAGDDVINLAERQAGVSLSGSAGANDVLTLFYPDGSVMKSGITVQNEGGKWVWKYTLTSENWTRLNADGADGVEKILQLQARNTSTGVDSLKVAHKLSIDTVAPPANLLLSLDKDTGSSDTDGVTHQGKVNVTRLAAGAQWEYQIDNALFQTGSGNSVQVTQEGAHTLTVRQYDSAGNRSAAQTLNMTLDTTPPGAPIIALEKIGGTVNALPVTNNDTIRVTGLEAKATWQWRLNRSDFSENPDWSNGSGNSFSPTGMTPNQTRNWYVEVRQLDQAGNPGSVSRLSFTLDTTPPRTPRLALVANSGGDDALRVTNDGRIDVLDLDADSAWQYSTDGGATWSTGSGNRFTVNGDGDKQLRVRQTDVAGNTSTSTVLTMKLDTVAPVKPGLATLVNDSGRLQTDLLTNDARLQAPTPSEADLRFEYSVNNGAWTDISQAIKGAKDGGSDGDKNVRLRSRDRAGNVSEAGDVFSFKLDTQGPAKPAPAILANDTGDDRTDGITSNGRVVPSGPPEPGTSFEYSLDGGAWTDINVGIKGEKDGGTDGRKNVRLRTKDAAGNASDPSEVFGYTLDTKAPAKATLALVKPAVNGVTDDGTVKVANLDADARWEYSQDRGATWSAGSGDRFRVKGGIDGGGHTDGAKGVQVRQIDKAGNTTVSDVLELNLSTRFEAPTVSVTSPLKTLSDGTALLDASTGPNRTVALEVSGRRGNVAVLTRDDGTEIERKNLDANGKASFNLNRSLTVSGLKTVAGGNTTANAVYTLLSSDEALALRNGNGGGVPFSAAYLAKGGVSIDLGKPVYSTGNAAGDWFVWSAIGGGYVISRKNDSSEWFREAPSSQPAQTPETVGAWVALNRGASQVADDLLRNNGVSTHQSRLDGVNVLNANGARDAAWRYQLKQVDAQGRISEAADLKLRMVTTAPSLLDLDAFTDGVQASRSIVVSNADVSSASGVALMPQVATPKASDIRFIELVSDNAGASPVDSLLLDRAVGINNNLAQVDNRSIGGVTGLSYKVSTVAKKSTVTLTKTDGSAFTGDEARNVLQSLRLQNLGFDTGKKSRSVDISLGDGSGHRSADLNRVTVLTDGSGLLVDLDARQAGVQTSHTRYINSPTKLAFDAAGGERFLDNVAAPASATAEIQLRFNGLDGNKDAVLLSDNYRYSPARPNVFYGDIGGVTGVFWFLPADKPGLTVIRKQQDGALLTPAEVKAILEGIAIRCGTPPGSLERSMDITLVTATGSGTTSRATLVLDTRAPVLDLDANTPGIQIQSSKSVRLDEAITGVKLFNGEMSAPIAQDIGSLRLTLPRSGDASNDDLILGNERFATRSNIDFSGSLGGVSGLELHYAASTGQAAISRTGGAPMDGLQVKAILESLKYRFASAGARNIAVEVADQAGNVARGDVTLTLDTTVPAQLTTTMLAETQKAFGVAKMENIFGSPFFPITSPHNLNKGEGVALTNLPSGFANAASFLGAIRGVSAEWGGVALTGNPNSSNPNLKSYTLFNQPLNPGQEVAVMQQAGSDALGSWLSFTLVRQAGRQADDVYLNHLGSFVLNHLDLYRSETSRDKSQSGYDLANVGLLYQIDTHRPNKTPTLQVGYDASRAAVGDVVALFEGGTMLARKVLTAADLGSGTKTVNLTVAQSLAPGEHDIVARYTDLAGNTVNGTAQHVSVAGGGDPVTLTDLAVRSSKQAPAAVQALNASENRYAVINDLDTSDISGHSASGPVISGKVGGGRDSDRYVVTVEMGGKVLAFDEVGAGDFSISLSAGSLAPGLYRDLTVTASRASGNEPGQSTAVQGLKLGWYWAAQSVSDIFGGNGNDDIVIGTTHYSAASFVQTGAGQDKVIVGAFGRSDNLAATVGDFVLGVDKVEVFNQSLTQANLSRFVTASAGVNPNDTRLSIDLDGAGPGTLTYTLMLQNVAYNSANTATIFGL
ncbi:adhesin [Herbaspirillum seropedicae]|nr:adhesin [Herbaspirillum seropedicae]UMU23772.1 adhesin [Herbaspirillum seropedicae]